MHIDDFLKIGKASDLKDPRDRVIFRLLEIFPGAISWLILILIFILSWQKPFFISVFIIVFAVFWLFRTIYFSFHLNSTFKKMKENEKKDWLDKIKKLSPQNYSLKINSWKDIYHLVILPVSREPLEIAREAFISLQKSDYPKDRMIIVFSAEESQKQYLAPIVEEIEKEFSDKFFKLLITWHPSNIKGEIPGHGANDAWACQEVKKKIIDPLNIPYENIITSSFDIDTCVFSRYFSCLTYYFLTIKNPTRASYQPIPLYINNIWQAPFFSRIFAFSATFWQMMCQERPEILLTFSSHSMSFKSLVDVGYKQANVVSDDSRIFWQCFFRYNGDYRVVPIFYPVSMDANVSKSFWRTAVNVYKQQRRWAYGVGEIPFFLFGFLKKIKSDFNNKKIPFYKKLNLSAELIVGHWFWATVSIMIFCLGWLPIFLGGPDFSQTLVSYNLPKMMSFILTILMIGLVASAYLTIVLLPPKPPGYGRFRYFTFFIEWFMLPFIMIFFTSIPALDAQTRWMFGRYMGFWVTEKVRK